MYKIADMSTFHWQLINTTKMLQRKHALKIDSHTHWNLATGMVTESFSVSFLNVHLVTHWPLTTRNKKASGY